MTAGKLTARAVATMKPGSYGDGGGLYLIVGPNRTRTWVYRFTWHGNVKMMGLGAANVVTLAEARALRDGARRLRASGINPIEARRFAEKTAPTFGELADEVLEAKRPGWRNAKHAAQWEWSLRVGCAALRPKLVDAIEVADVLAVLKPLWLEKPETASRLRQRIEAVLSAAKARGFRSGENPAAWRGHLEHLLPKRPRLAKSHHAAMAYEDVPSFLERLRGEDYTAARALEFAILTAARSGEVFGARWSEIDFASKTWTLAAARMKSGREHRVPLCSRAVEILETLAAYKTGQYIFPSPRGDRPLSNIAMQKVLTRLAVDDATVHGFRSAFRDWAGNETHFAREVAEAALAHVVGDKAEQAYRRSYG
jgi:integrase